MNEDENGPDPAYESDERFVNDDRTWIEDVEYINEEA